MNTHEKYHAEFIEQSLFRLNENAPRIIRCLDLLTEEQVWSRSSSHSNSVGNLILHLCGNVKQYIQHGVDNQPDTRQRDLEFSTNNGVRKAELQTMFCQTIENAERVIKHLHSDTMTDEKMVQVFMLSKIGIIIHVIEHLSYHTGQIASITKSICDQDLGFYGDVDL